MLQKNTVLVKNSVFLCSKTVTIVYNKAKNVDAKMNQLIRHNPFYAVM